MLHCVSINLWSSVPGSAIAISAAVMVPQHAATQGFVWPTILFYLAVDVMLGASAALTKSILPGIVTHAIGLFVFFALVWPGDRNRTLIWQHGADAWFWIHVAQAIVFASLAVALFLRLAKLGRAQKNPDQPAQKGSAA